MNTYQYLAWFIIEAVDISTWKSLAHRFILFNSSRICSPLRARAYQPTAGLTSNCPHIKMEYRPIMLGLTFDLHVEFSSHFWLSRAGLFTPLIGPDPPCRGRNPRLLQRWTYFNCNLRISRFSTVEYSS